MKNVLNTLPIGLIDAALNSSYGAELGAGENTHEPALRFIGQLVQKSQNEELLFAIVEARLPKDYSGNTLKEVSKMIASAIKKGFDQAKEKKAASSDSKQSSEALAEIKSKGMNLCHDKLGKSYATFDDHINGSVVVPIESSEMRRRVQFAYFETNGKAISSTALAEVIDTLNAQASFRGATEAIHLRIGGDEREAYIDRGTDEKSFIRLANGK